MGIIWKGEHKKTKKKQRRLNFVALPHNNKA